MLTMLSLQLHVSTTSNMSHSWLLVLPASSTPSIVVSWALAVGASALVVSVALAAVAATSSLWSLHMASSTSSLGWCLVRLLLQHSGRFASVGCMGPTTLAHRLPILMPLVHAPGVALDTASTGVSKMHHPERSGVRIELVSMQT